MIRYVLAVWAGAMAGFFTAALLAAARNNDDEDDR